MTTEQSPATMTDFRALCVELTDCLEKSDWPHQYKPVFEPWIYIARKALAEPEPEVPTKEDLFSLDQLRDKWNAHADAFNTWDELGIDEIVWWAQRQALARWGNYPGSPDSSTLQPVPITERLPEPEDCNGEGNVWAWRRFDPKGDMDNGDFWCLASCEWLGDEDSGFTHWLPAHALPVPS
jgi:hypothetical protein